jgi:tetratricopeptide (TPR) repeat protein
MKKLSYLLVLIVVTFLSVNCSSNIRNLQRGDYYNATMGAIKTLRSNPKSKKSIEVLQQAYPLAKENSMRKIQNALDVDVAGKYSIIADEYLVLNAIADAIYTCPKAMELFPHPEQYSKELREILPLAFEESYKQGERLLQLNTLRDAREAYYQFLKAEYYMPDYKDVKEKIQVALYAATLKVVVQKPITPERYQLSADFFYDNLMAQISKITANQFVRFYTYGEAKEEGLDKPDQYLVLSFEDFTVGNLRETTNNSEVSRDSVLVGTTTVNGEKQNVYGTVKAKLTVYTREVISEGILSAKIINAYNNKVEESRNFPGGFVWVNEWASYKGDERALTNKQLKMTETKPIMPPPEQDLFIEFTRPILDQAVGFVRNYYSSISLPL